MKLLSSHTMIFGLKGTGKSNWLQWCLTEHEAYENHLIYDVCREHGSLNRYLPRYRSGKKARVELGKVISEYVTQNHRDLRPDLLILEEVSRIAPNSGGAPDELHDLVDLSRHYSVGIVGVARRPAQVDTNLVEMADNILVFNIRGINDRRRLNNESPGSGDAAANLGSYQFLRIHKNREWTVHSPVDEMDTTGAL